MGELVSKVSFEQVGVVQCIEAYTHSHVSYRVGQFNLLSLIPTWTWTWILNAKLNNNESKRISKED
jgi:hypothetical protein